MFDPTTALKPRKESEPSPRASPGPEIDSNAARGEEIGQDVERLTASSEPIAAWAALDDVDAVSTAQKVGAAFIQKSVVTEVSGHAIGALAWQNAVVAGARADEVLAFEAVDEVIAAPPGNDVRSGCSNEDIRIRASDDCGFPVEARWRSHRSSRG